MAKVGSRAVGRRAVLAAIGGFAAVVSRPALSAPAVRSLSFASIHTGETLATDYWVSGDYVPDAMEEVNWLLRDHRNDQVSQIDPALLDFLHAVRAQLDSDAAFQVISGYRSPATNEMLARRSNGVAKKSFHLKGMAIDVNLPGRDLDRLRQAAIDLQRGGVGYYPRPDFVHIDVGRPRQW